MKKIQKQLALEQIFYFIVWVMIWGAPILNFFIGSHKHHTNVSLWDEVSGAWAITLPFFLLFLLSNYLLLPRLMLKKRYMEYILSAAFSIIVLFYCLPEGFRVANKPDFPQKEEIPAPRNDAPDIPQHEPPLEHRHKPEHLRPNGPDDVRFSPDNEKSHHAPFFKPLSPDLQIFINMIVAILTLGFNMATKLFIKSLHNEATLKELERQRLESELQYLKYQLNPHFFMNTLNNIHALVDIDGEKAKSTIIELSKLMRYVLYESNTQSVRLEQEIQFLKNYITLMRLRYTDKLEIIADFPLVPAQISIPPLLFISLIENAFKHGVSYKEPSYIHIQMKTEEGKVHFTCENSKHVRGGKEHGIGTENVKKRLKLLFGNNYTYAITENEKSYHVLLIIPSLS